MCTCVAEEGKMEKQELLQYIIQRILHVKTLILELQPMQHSPDLYVSTGALRELSALYEESVWLADLLWHIQSKETTV